MIEPVGVLGEIVARKRKDVAERLARVTLEELRDLAKPTELSLKAALARPRARFIMEVKRVSPSQGELRASADPAAVARAYRGAADAISVLTDGPYFGGSFEDLRAVRAVFQGPVLAKDFVVDVRQVPEARLHGADAVLVMLSVLEDEEAASVIAEAKRLGMDALVETHDEQELARAIALGAELIGINNRDLRTLKVDLATTERLAGLVPEDRIVVAESGIESRADVERLSAHADAFLVGSSLMRAEDPAAAARALAFGRVKVCGLTEQEDLALAAASGASYAGIVMVPGTPRAVNSNEADRLAAAAAEAGIPLVAVFRNEKLAEVAQLAHRLRLRAVQLHGQEDSSYIAALKTMVPIGCEVWAAGGVGESERGNVAHRNLFDTVVNGQSGGTGQAFDWSELSGRSNLSKDVLAGGLKPENAAAASRVGAYALDVSSGVEQAPGKKDAAKLQSFFEALRLPVRHEVKSC